MKIFHSFIYPWLKSKSNVLSMLSHIISFLFTVTIVYPLRLNDTDFDIIFFDSSAVRPLIMVILYGKSE